jgi:hypothetical protein
MRGVDNACRYMRERQIALVLQQSSLPSARLELICEVSDPIY